MAKTFVDRCFLDMDGVLADFVTRCLEAHGATNPYLEERNLGIFDLEKILGITATQFWKPIDSFDFWASLPKTEESDEIVSMAYSAFGEENVAVLTAPSMGEGCVTGKRAWIRRHYPQLQKRVVFSGIKDFFAAEHIWLIDDRDSNVESFRNAGGNVVLVPRPWNRDHHLAGNVLFNVRTRLWESIRPARGFVG